MDPAKQRRAVAVYDARASGWPWTDLALVCETNRTSLANWCLEAEELGQAARWRIRLELVRSDKG